MIESEGTRIARELRAKCNKLTVEERQKYFDKGMAIIYAGRQCGKTVMMNAYMKRYLEKIGS